MSITVQGPRAGRWMLAGLVGLACLMGGAVQAQEHREPGREGREPRGERHGPGPGAALRLDERYRHDHWYPAPGYAVGVLPGGSVSVGFRGGRWWFHGGVWFRGGPGGYIVAPPPVGILLPVLPPAFVTLWIGGAPFYYANGVYYQPVAGQGYAVVDPPSGAEQAQPAPAGGAPAPRAFPDPVIYPRNGQTAAQLEADRRSCHDWAMAQPQAAVDGSVYARAIAACMDGRGYTVK